MTIHRKRSIDLLQALLCALLLTPLVSSPQEPETQQGEQVVVTGSRIPATNAEGPQEVKIYTREQIDRSGGTTLAEFLNTLPDVSLSITENGFNTPTGTTTIRLHGLPIGTTLILLNGRRVGTSGAPQIEGLTYFDLNMIPLATVERIELVSQGSSAVYGSDAIAGVVNIVLKKDFSGFEANSRYSAASDIHQEDVDLSWGQHWEKGSISATGSYLNRTELPGYARLLTSDNNYVRYGGRNADFYMCPNQANIYALNGGNLPGLNAPYAAVPAGYTGTPSRAEFVPTAGSLNQCSLFKYASLIPGTERAGVLVSGTYRLAPKFELYGNVMFSHTGQFEYNAPPILFGEPGFQQYTVGAANPFNPFGQSVGVSEMLSTLGRDAQDLRTNYLYTVLGLRGDLLQSWKWDLGISQSQDRSRYTQPDLNAANLQAALNSTSPTTALNPFVSGPPAPQTLLQSLVTTDYTNSAGRSTVLDATVRGPLTKLPGGLLQIAFGGEYERDALEQDQFYFPGPAVPTSFHRRRYAFFAEGRLPILGPVSGSEGDRFAVTVAGRFDHDEQFGSERTPQFGLELRPLESLLLRASFSRAFRAPDLVDLYAARQIFNGVVSDPLRGNATEDINLTTGGNPNLQPEKGVARTIGLLYSHAVFAEPLRLAITHWSIDETDAIQQFQPQVVVNNAALFPGAVTRASTCQGPPPCPITAVSATFQNFGFLSVAGFDYELAYQLHTVAGVFLPQITATQTYRYVATLTPSSPGVNSVSAAQDTGNWAPRWKGALALEWRLANWTADIAGRYVSRYRDYDSTRAIGDFWLTDLNVRYALGKVLGRDATYWRNLYARLGAVNLFNRLPQFSNFEFGIVGYDPTQGDIRGRFLYAQLGLGW